MSVTICSEIVDLDKLIPGTVDIERENKDVERLTPWVFQHTDIAKENCTMRWPREQGEFRDFIYHLHSHRAELDFGESGDIELASSLKASETITLPMKNWKMPKREHFTQFMRSQGTMLKVLMQTIYWNLDLAEQVPELHFPVLVKRTKYVIGGEQYASRPEGATMTGSEQDPLPVISYIGWFDGQTWGDLLAEILSIMLGHLAKNISIDFQDQEVYVIGFYGSYIYIARGVFTTDLISRVQSRGPSENEVFELKFSRGYNLCLKEDWIEAMHALVRLLRYILSGNAKVSAVRAQLHT